MLHPAMGISINRLHLKTGRQLRFGIAGQQQQAATLHTELIKLVTKSLRWCALHARHDQCPDIRWNSVVFHIHFDQLIVINDKLLQFPQLV